MTTVENLGLHVEDIANATALATFSANRPVASDK